MIKIVNRFFVSLIYAIGLVVIATVFHELYHWLSCGGEWVAGFGYLKGQRLIGGLTWCANEDKYWGGEIIPYIISGD